MLVEPSAKYCDRVLNSANYLNCPKHMLNDDLDSMFRQFIGDEKKQFEAIKEYLTSMNIGNSGIKAIKFIEWRKGITVQKFNELNKNSYVDNPPKHVIDLHNKINDWYENNKTYEFAYLGNKGIEKQISYPHKIKHR